jgi:hypothetical protein
MTGLTKTRLYELMEKREFPRQVHIGARAVGWYEDEVQEWIRRRSDSRAVDGSARVDSFHSKPTKAPHVVTGDLTYEDLPSRRRHVKGKKNGRPPAESNGPGRSPNLERIGKTSDGREMLWDRTTGNVLVVIGQLSADWAS